ncbi:alpha/beta fold hydrolase [Nonomuraea sp. NPDC050202]|uniref:alpha/beta fold hydrolase n=1 Tax=Nonomuraea sp. NPDC050202 TaxID=3155035 RepID=UPI0033F48511
MIITYPVQAAGIRSRIVGTRTGPREIWLIHGIGGRADRWRSCFESLAQAGYRVRAVDLPGHGFASCGRRPAHRGRLLGFSGRAHGMGRSPRRVGVRRSRAGLVVRIS